MNQKNEEHRYKQVDTDATPIIPPHVIKFLNSLPVVQDTMQQILQFRQALGRFLGDVDRIALFISINCDLLLTDKWSGRKDILMIVEASSDEIPEHIGVNANVIPVQQILQGYLQYLRQMGFSFDEYQQPCTQMYSVETDENHLGMIALFRRHGASPISMQTIELMERLRPFFTFMLSHLVAQNAYIRRADLMFHTILDHIVFNLDLTSRQREIFALRLMGLQRKAIADRLFLSEETISKHIQKILRKGKAHSVIELFMRYYVPGLEDLSDPRFGAIHSRKEDSRKGRKKEQEKEYPAPPKQELMVW